MDDPDIVVAAHKTVTEFINSRHCKSRTEVEAALLVLQLMATDALDAVRNGQMEKLQ